MSNWALQTVTGTTTLPITLDEVKAHLRVDHNDEDGLIYGYLRGELDWFEETAGRALMTRTMDLYLDGWPPYSSDGIELPRAPLQSVTSVAYTTAGSSAQWGSTLNSTAYWVDSQSEPGRLLLKLGESWPSNRLETGLAVRVRYAAGYGTAPSAVPEGIRQALLLLVSDRYEHREDTIVGSIIAPRSIAVERLVAPWRVFTFT